MPRPSFRLRRFMLLYSALWAFLLPLALAYLWLRGRKDPLYRQHLSERFGRYPTRFDGSVWVHAVSLGELRSAVPVIRALLERGEQIVITVFTPAGRREAERIFAAEMVRNNVAVVWVPLELPFAFKRFFASFSPKFALVMEIEIWPRMIMAAKKASVPLYLCNAQYPQKSYDRDLKKSRWRADVTAQVAGALVKSDLQRDRFASVGVQDIAVTGELRFDQPVPDALVQAGERWKATLKGRKVITIPSVVEGEDAVYIGLIDALKGPDAPLVIYVPRAPERFDLTYDMLIERGFKTSRRSDVFDADLNGHVTDIDVLLGDSFGEMYFYLAACDVAVIGGSFIPQGAHNVSEPLVLGKPCIVGPHVWTIEFPVVEAMAAGVVQQVQSGSELAALINSGALPKSTEALAFAQTQMGSTARTINALEARGLI